MPIHFQKTEKKNLEGRENFQGNRNFHRLISIISMVENMCGFSLVGTLTPGLYHRTMSHLTALPNKLVCGVFVYLAFNYE